MTGFHQLPIFSLMPLIYTSKHTLLYFFMHKSNPVHFIQNLKVSTVTISPPTPNKSHTCIDVWSGWLRAEETFIWTDLIQFYLIAARHTSRGGLCLLREHLCSNVTGGSTKVDRDGTKTAEQRGRKNDR